MQVVVGRIGRAHGVRGEVSVDVRTDVPDRRFVPGVVLDAAGRSLTLLSARPHGRRWLMRFGDVIDRTAAESLAGLELIADVPDDETLPDDEYFDRELVGLDVATQAGGVVGTVVGVEHPGVQDLLVVKIGDRRLLVPFVAALVDVDLDARCVTVNDRPGLLDPSAAQEAR